MIIKSCYIENFGTFHQQTFTFTEGLNVIKEKNGWGKTTLATFLKAMFYGLEYKTRSRDLYERTRYLPWQGGNYGGYLIFSTQGQEYKIVRFFGKKAADDEFKLYDMATNLECEDYSQRIGEELFGIDCDSFERSILFSLDGKPPALQDSLSAKLGNLIDNTDDINNFENAYNTLDVLATSIKAKRGSSGMLNHIDEQLNTLKESLQECDNAQTQMNLLQQQMDDCTAKVQQLEAQQDSLKQEISGIDLQSKKREFNQLWERKKEKEAQVRRFLDIFQGSLPEKEQVEQHIALAREAEALQRRLAESSVTDKDTSRLTELKNLFTPHLPTSQELSACEDALLRYQEQKQLLERSRPSQTEIDDYKNLSRKYGDCPPTSSAIDKCMEQFHQVTEWKETIHTRQYELEHLKLEKQQQLLQQHELERQKALKQKLEREARRELEQQLAQEQKAREQAVAASRKQRKVMLMLIAVVLLAAGGILLGVGLQDNSTLSPYFSIPLGVGGIFLFLAALRIKVHPQTVTVPNFMKDFPEEEESSEFTEDTDIHSDISLTNASLPYDSEVQHAENQLTQLINQKDALEKEYLTFLQRIDPLADTSNIPRLLSDMKVEVSRLTALRQKFQTFQQLCDSSKADMEAYQSCIDTFLSFFREKCPNMEDTRLLPFIREEKVAYEALQQRIEEYNRNNRELSGQKASLTAFLGDYLLPEHLLTSLEKMDFIRDTCRDCQTAQAELSQLNSQLNRFMDTHDMDALEQLSAPSRTLEELQQTSTLCEQQLRQLVDQRASYQQTWDTYSVIADRRQDLESEQEQLLERRNALHRKHKLLTQTAKLLQAAKDKLSTGYLSDTITAFQKYLDILDESGASIRLDTTLSASLEEYGKPRQSDYFSSGYKDLMNICTRLALVDAMYQEERPFLILDDPFVNLDDEKLAQATRFLHQLGSEYQVLYFVCHQSRTA